MRHDRPRLIAAATLVIATATAVSIYRGEAAAPELRVFEPLARGFAAVAGGALRTLGFEVARDGAVLRHPSGFALEVTWNCTAWLHAVFFLAGLLTFRVPVRRGLVRAATGVGVILLVNGLRLVGLFVVGATFPSSFDWTHHFAGEALLAGTVLLLWWQLRVGNSLDTRKVVWLTDSSSLDDSWPIPSSRRLERRRVSDGVVRRGEAL